MPFTNSDFPGQIFKTIEEWEEAKKKRLRVEASLTARREQKSGSIVATLLPLDSDTLERKIVSLERQLRDLQKIVEEPPANEKHLEPGLVLYGESQGRTFSLEVLDRGFLCSDGKIYQSLSGAALGVSGNRRSGWQFWKDKEGTPAGELSGRFSRHVGSKQRHSGGMSGV